MIPVACFTCGKRLGKFWKRWRHLQCIQSRKQSLNELGLRFICCRTNMITFVDVTEQILDFERANDVPPPTDTSAEFITIHTDGKRPLSDPEPDVDPTPSYHGDISPFVPKPPPSAPPPAETPILPPVDSTSPFLPTKKRAAPIFEDADEPPPKRQSIRRWIRAR